MKRFLFLAPLVSLSIAGCAGLPGLPAPGGVATAAAHTSADEEALKRCEQTYALTRTMMELGVDSGLIHGAAAASVAALDNRLYGVLLTCRTAYKLFGSAELIRAADDMNKQAADLGPAIKQGAD